MEPIILHTTDTPRVSVFVLSQHDPAMLAACLASVARNIGRELPYELVLVLNGADPDVTAFVQRYVRGARVVESVVNLGFSGGNNHAARISAGEFLLLLNDDAVVAPGWVEALVAAADELPRAGAIGSRILFPDGRLQEAGSVIWADGSTAPIGRDQPGGDPRFLFRRRVDYSSFCSVLIRREAWQEVGGLDFGYFPAYYEDTDFCLALRRAGWQVWYEPASVVEHAESRSTVSRFKAFLFRRNGARFREKWAAELSRQVPAEPWDPRAVQAAIDLARGRRPQLLLIDDKLPDPSIGAGFARAHDLLTELAGRDYAVTLHPTDDPAGNPLPLGRLGVQVHHGSADDLRAHLGADGVRYDAVLVSRPHNWAYFAADVRRLQPAARLLYDAEALWHVRLERQAALGSGRPARRLAAEAAAYREFEAVIPLQADRVVVVSADEAAFFHSVPGHCPVDYVPPLLPDHAPTDAGFTARRDLLMTAGWGAGPDSPNGDGLRWFVRTVLPLVLAEQPWVELRVTGDRPPSELLRLAGPNVRFLGHVEDLRAAYDSARVVVAPMRYGAGVKRKTTDAMQYAVPLVTTTVGAEGIPLERGDEIEVTDDPAEFAARVLRLLTDPAHWTATRSRLVELAAGWQRRTGQSWTSVLEAALTGPAADGRTVLEPPA